MYEYTIEQFNIDVESVARQINKSGREYHGIYGIPQGGIPFAIGLSNALRIPLVERGELIDFDDECLEILVVDDLLDSGATLSEWWAYDRAVIGYKPESPKQPGTLFCGREFPQEWIHFWWEPEGTDDPENMVTRLIEYIGEDPTREGLIETPARVIRSFERLYGGYKKDIADIMKTFTEDSCDEMVVLKDITLHSTCVPGDQVINGVGKGASKARSFEIGDQLWTLSNGIPTKTTIEKISTYKADSIVKLNLANGTSIRVTQDHPIKTKKGWEEAGDLQFGDKVEYINPKTLCKQQHEFNEGWDLGYCVGAIASDGAIQNNLIKLQVRDKWFCEQFVKSLKAAFGIKAEITEIDHSGGFREGKFLYFRVNVVSSEIAHRISKILGITKKTGNKTKVFKFPKVLGRSLKMFKGFLKGYIDGDGSRVSQDTGSTIISSNIEFLKELSEFIEAKFTEPKLEKCGRLYVSDKWHVAHWYGRHGFEKVEESFDFGESSFIRVDSIEHLPAQKVYSFKCREYPTFLVRGILTHNCEHHMLPFSGVAHIGYIPNGKVIGISKLARLVEIFARRLQIQERIGEQVTEALMHHLQPLGAACVIEARHSCMTARGVEQQTSTMLTSSVKGVMKDKPETRAEFMGLII